MSPRPTSRVPRWLRATWLLLALTGAIFAQDIWRSRLEYFLPPPESWSADLPTPLRATPTPAASNYAPNDFVARLDNTVSAISGQPVFGSARSKSAPNSPAATAAAPMVEINGSFPAADPYAARRIEAVRIPAPISQVAIAQQNAPAPVAATPSIAPNLLAASTNWTTDGSGSWSNAGNWDNGVPNASGVTANIIANITNDRTVFLDISATVGNLYIGDPDGTNHYTIAQQLPLLPARVTRLEGPPIQPSGPSGNTLTFDSGSTTTASTLQQNSSSAGDTVNVPMLFKNDLNITNLATNQFNIGGSLGGAGAPNTLLQLTFSGNIRASGSISNGGTGSVVATNVTSGTVIFAGTNSYTGSTLVSGGTLLVNGNNSTATGIVEVSGTGTVLGGTGTIGGSNAFFFNGTVTANTVTTTGTLTFLGGVSLNGSEGPGGTYLANISGTASDLLAISGNLTLGPGSTLDVEGMLDGVTTYTLATFGQHIGMFSSVSGVPANYMVVYNMNDIELVPAAVPEPSTWIAAVLSGILLVVRLARRRV